MKNLRLTLIILASLVMIYILWEDNTQLQIDLDKANREFETSYQEAFDLREELYQVHLKCKNEHQ